MIQTKRKAKFYDVTLRRDVQQKAQIWAEAGSPREAIEIAEALVGESAWQLEEHIGTHAPKVTASAATEIALLRKRRDLVARRTSRRKSP